MTTAEEMADVGNAVRVALESHLARLLFYLLKLRADPRSHARHGWEVSIAQSRDEIAKRATGSLREHPARYLPTAYAHARRRALRLVVRPPEWLPEPCPWSVAQVLDDDFFPSEEGTSSATSRASGGLPVTPIQTITATDPEAFDAAFNAVLREGARWARTRETTNPRRPDACGARGFP